MSTRQRALRMSVRSGEPIDSPNVSSKPTSRGPRHCANEGAATLTAPYAFRVCLRKFPPRPWLKRATASGPYSALIFCSFSATWERASSHVTSVHFSSPRTLARRRGARSRSVSKWAPTPPVPRGHSRPSESGSSGLPSIFQRTPSRTVAIALHFQKHRSQKVGTVRMPFSAGPREARRPGREPKVPAAAATEAPAPVILRNRRRKWTHAGAYNSEPRASRESRVCPATSWRGCGARGPRPGPAHPCPVGGLGGKAPEREG